MKAIINATLYDFNTFKDHAYIIFDDTIREVGDMKDFEFENYEIVDGNGFIVMPGLVNGHDHIYSTFARGLNLPFNPVNFQDILNQLWWKLDKQLDLETIYYSGIVHGTDAVKKGITTIIDHHASGLDIKGSLNILSKAVSEDVGIRGIYCFETSDRFDVTACIEENMDFAKNNQSKMKSGLMGIHAGMSVSEETLIAIKKAAHNLPIHMHVAESSQDERHSIKEYRHRIVERLHHHGLLSEDSLLAHCLYIDQSEAKLIASAGARVVYNVTSNMNNGVGLPDYDLINGFDIPLMIGNDGLSTGMAAEYQNLYYAMHLKYHSPNAFGFNDLIRAINNTYDYASKRLNAKLGKFEKDYEADILMIPYCPPTPLNSETVFGHLFFGLFNQFRPKHVWCGGKQKVTNYQASPTLFELNVAAKEVSAAFWERLR